MVTYLISAANHGGGVPSWHVAAHATRQRRLAKVLATRDTHVR